MVFWSFGLDGCSMYSAWPLLREYKASNTSSIPLPNRGGLPIDQLGVGGGLHGPLEVVGGH